LSSGSSTPFRWKSVTSKPRWFEPSSLKVCRSGSCRPLGMLGAGKSIRPRGISGTGGPSGTGFSGTRIRRTRRFSRRVGGRRGASCWGASCRGASHRRVRARGVRPRGTGTRRPSEATGQPPSGAEGPPSLCFGRWSVFLGSQGSCLGGNAGLLGCGTGSLREPAGGDFRGGRCARGSGWSGSSPRTGLSPSLSRRRSGRGGPCLSLEPSSAPERRPGRRSAAGSLGCPNSHVGAGERGQPEEPDGTEFDDDDARGIWSDLREDRSEGEEHADHAHDEDMESARDQPHHAEGPPGGNGEEGEGDGTAYEQVAAIDVQREVGKSHGSQQLGQLQYPKGHNPTTDVFSRSGRRRLTVPVCRGRFGRGATPWSWVVRWARRPRSEPSPWLDHPCPPRPVPS
jgi:hypothetical protein